MTKLLEITLAAVLFGGVVSARAAIREEMVPLTEGRRVAVAVPSGFTFAAGKDDTGPITLKLQGANDEVSVDIQFLPDPEGRFGSARSQRELLNQLFGEHVDSSTEKAMRFEELEPRIGSGTYCVFTDASLVGKAELPKGEYLHLTTGIKVWPGVVAVFRCFSNDTTSAQYRSVLRMLRESVHEKPVPMK
jgi:hypothetical protein